MEGSKTEGELKYHGKCAVKADQMETDSIEALNLSNVWDKQKQLYTVVEISV